MPNNVCTSVLGFFYGQATANGSGGANLILIYADSVGAFYAPSTSLSPLFSALNLNLIANCRNNLTSTNVTLGFTM